MFDEILVAVDNSEQAQAALRAGIELATLLNSHLTALHVNNPAESVAGNQSVDVKTQGLLRRLENLPDATALCRNGQPTGEIIAAAEEIGAQLILMGTHGRGPLKQLILGSTAEGVVRMAPCPVITVQQPIKGKTRPLFARVLVAVDASDPALGALGMALQLSHQIGAQVAIVHVANTVYPWRAPITETGLAPLSEIRRHGQMLLNRIVADLPKEERCETFLRDGEPAWEILAAAKEWKAELIVLGTSGYTHFQQFVLGSVANAVMRGAACPVMTVPPHAMTKSRAEQARTLQAIGK